LTRNLSGLNNLIDILSGNTTNTPYLVQALQLLSMLRHRLCVTVFDTVNGAQIALEFSEDISL